MKKSKSIVVDTKTERSPLENKKLKQNQEARNKEISYKYQAREHNAPGLNEKEGSDEMEDLYREEENRASVEAA